MDNKKTGRFISQRRKELNITQKQLAEKLNVTDKAVSKWETGNGAPDIALLSSLSNALDVTVIEILDGEYAENTCEKLQTEKIVIEALQKAKKIQIKTVITIFATLLILFTLVNAVTYAYWGNRHKILYDVDTVFVHQREDDANMYDIYYNCSVKNWWFDFNEYNYNLTADLRGEPGGWYFESEKVSFLSNNLKKNTFIIHVEFDKSTVMGTTPTFKELIMMSRFSAYDSNGEYDDRANLYMNDFKDVKIVII
ncbi:MAG: helix-turn-helix transcriptional regulator [Clostridia bacterium]|nr:helix-turn-helix transcriptional regulator [Clostridia bacterium]